MKRRQPKPDHPPGTLATTDQIATWDQTTRDFRTCWYCGNTYLTASDATRCELAHETHGGHG